MDAAGAFDLRSAREAEAPGDRTLRWRAVATRNNRMLAAARSDMASRAVGKQRAYISAACPEIQVPMSL